VNIHALGNAPWVASGYGQQLALLLPRLKAAGHTVSMTANFGHEGRAANIDGITTFSKGFDTYGADIVDMNAAVMGADLILTCIDAQVLNPKRLQKIPWLCWFPVDSEPASPAVLDAVRQARYRAVMSRFGGAMLDKAGLDWDYMPLAVDIDIYSPKPRDEVRKELGVPDKFVVGAVGMNKGWPMRKNWRQNIEGFQRFHEKHPDSLYYLHTQDGTHITPDGTDLTMLCRFLGLSYSYAPDWSGEIVFADQYGLVGGYPVEQMAKLYNAMDVYCLVSAGEGFGVPLVEAQSCNVPVIAGDWTAMSELVFSGWKIPKSEAEPFFVPSCVDWYIPHIDAVKNALETVYTSLSNDMRDSARLGALEYDIDLLFDKYWRPLLERIEQEIKTK
jgi:glycosyltransferase involved in cell wall biosynthesis